MFNINTRMYYPFLLGTLLQEAKIPLPDIVVVVKDPTVQKSIERCYEGKGPIYEKFVDPVTGWSMYLGKKL